MGTRHRSKDVVRGLHIGDPVTDRLTGGVFEGGGPRRHRVNGGTEEAHPEHVQSLSAHVFSAHVHHTLQAEAGTNGGGGHTMLASTGFGDHPLLTHPQSQKGLPKSVIDLVGTGVIQVFPLQPDAGTTVGTAVVLREPFRFVKRCSPTDIALQQPIEFRGERRIFPGLSSRLLQLGQCRHQCFWDVLTAVTTKTASSRWTRTDGEIGGRGLRGQGAGHEAMDRTRDP